VGGGIINSSVNNSFSHLLELLDYQKQYSTIFCECQSNIICQSSTAQSPVQWKNIYTSNLQCTPSKLPELVQIHEWVYKLVFATVSSVWEKACGLKKFSTNLQWFLWWPSQVITKDNHQNGHWLKTTSANVQQTKEQLCTQKYIYNDIHKRKLTNTQIQTHLLATF